MLLKNTSGRKFHQRWTIFMFKTCGSFKRQLFICGLLPILRNLWRHRSLLPVFTWKQEDSCKAAGQGVHFSCMQHWQTKVGKKKWLALYGPWRQQWHTWSHISVHQQRQACHRLSHVIKLDGETRQPDLNTDASTRWKKNTTWGLTFRWLIREYQSIHLTRPSASVSAKWYITWTLRERKSHEKRLAALSIKPIRLEVIIVLMADLLVEWLTSSGSEIRIYKNQVKSNVCPHVKILTNYYWP